MIITLTPNPSLDLLFRADGLVWNDANRIPMPRRRPGGQGINLVRAARVLDPDTPARAVAPLGGPVGRELRAALEAEGTPVRAVPIAGDTRVFVGVRDSVAGRSLLLNPRGPTITAAEAETLLEAVDEELRGLAGGPALDSGHGAAPAPSIWLAACGSLLPGLPEDFYARAGRLARDRGARFVPDGDGEALAIAAQQADLLVPNALEAARLLDRPVEGPAEAAAAARELLARYGGSGLRCAVVTLGADGAVAADADGTWHAHARPPDPQTAGALGRSSAVGAGDAFLAALLLAMAAETTPTALAGAVAAGTAVLLSTGSALLRAADVDEVRGWVEVRSEI